VTVPNYDKFSEQAGFWLKDTGADALSDLPHIFALFFQVRRAFCHIRENIVGTSKAIVSLRAAI